KSPVAVELLLCAIANPTRAGFVGGIGAQGNAISMEMISGVLLTHFMCISSQHSDDGRWTEKGREDLVHVDTSQRSLGFQAHRPIGMEIFAILVRYTETLDIAEKHRHIYAQRSD